jgi:hypothetical protein
MMVRSKINYDDQDDGRILKAARKQQYIIFPAPIEFLNNELKAELGMRPRRMTKNMTQRFVLSRSQLTPRTRIPRPTL